MTVKTSRANENARIIIDYSKCNACGLCASACKDISLSVKNGKLTVNESPVFGCLGCGQCAAICPNDAIHIEGRTLSKSDFIKMPEKENMAGYEQLHALMLGRRSIRDFKPKEVEDELIEKILASASTAPMGIPPSDVKVLVLKGKTKVREFSFDFLDYAKSLKGFFSPFMLALMRPFIDKNNYEAFKSFIIPLLNGLIEKQEKGEDWLLYDAPLAMYFYSAQFADPADSYIAATYAMLAAESLDLGSCMIGSIAPFLKKGGTKLKKKYGLNPKANDGIVVIFGYPRVKYHRAIKRSFAGVITR